METRLREQRPRPTAAQFPKMKRGLGYPPFLTLGQTFILAVKQNLKQAVQQECQGESRKRMFQPNRHPCPRDDGQRPEPGNQ